MRISLLYLPGMKMLKFFAVVFALIFATAPSAFAQDTLPRFSVEFKGNGRVVVSWTNPYPNLIQLAVQRSYDSVKRFGSVYSTTSPELPVNGFSDKVPEGVRVFYRIFYVMEGGAYFFTPSKQPTVSQVMEVTKTDSLREVLNTQLQSITETANRKELEKKLEDPNKPLYIRESDTSGYRIIPLKDFRSYRDSIIRLTKDTLVQSGTDTLFLKLYDPPFGQKTSQYVFTNKDGYFVIKLDDAAKKNYQVIIMEDNEIPVLDIKHVKEPLLILDKSNFYKAGWYKFTLKEGGRIKEKGKIFLPGDF